jgi:hypothetical protein
VGFAVAFTFAPSLHSGGFVIFPLPASVGIYFSIVEDRNNELLIAISSSLLILAIGTTIAYGYIRYKSNKAVEATS